MALIAPISIGSSWVNLYAESSIPVGTQVIVHVLSARSRIILADSAAQPTDSDGRVSQGLGDFYQNDSGDVGLWARCPTQAQVTIQEV